jgi:hypothetical protein
MEREGIRASSDLIGERVDLSCERQLGNANARARGKLPAGQPKRAIDEHVGKGVVAVIEKNLDALEIHRAFAGIFERDGIGMAQVEVPEP